MQLRAQSTIALMTLSALLLGGCGNVGMLGPFAQPGKQVSSKSVSSLTFEDAQAQLAGCQPQVENTISVGLPAVLRAPTDQLAQRQLSTLFLDAATRPLSRIPSAVDAAFGEFAVTAGSKRFSRVPENSALSRYVQGVADRICGGSKLPKFKVYLFDVPELNAFTSGSPHLVVYTGLLTELRDEAELAGVLSHEMTHGIKRHPVQGRLHQMAMQSAIELVDKLIPVAQNEQKMIQALVATLPAGQRQDLDFVMGYLDGKVSQAGLSNYKFSLTNLFAYTACGRSLEADADRDGVRYLRAAGYDPQALPDVFARFLTKAQGDERYDDHPGLGQRVGSLRDQIRVEGLANANLDRGTQRYSKALASWQPTSPGSDASSIVANEASSACF